MPTKTKKTEPEIEEVPVIQNIDDNKITFNRTQFFSVLVIISFAVGILTGFFIWGYNQTAVTATNQSSVTTNQTTNQVGATPQAPQYVRYDIPTEGYPSLGPNDAPITIVEFIDFQCPFCKRFNEETYQPLLDAYPGQIRFVYRNLPLTSIHPDAMSAAVASLCANEQNAYMDFHDKLFSRDVLGRDVYLQYANELNLNVAEFSTCLDSGKFDDFISQDMDFAFNLGVQSTPTFFVNGLAVVGAQPLSNFQNLIDKELAGEIP